jgi:hypothetical protein
MCRECKEERASREAQAGKCKACKDERATKGGARSARREVQEVQGQRATREVQGGKCECNEGNAKKEVEVREGKEGNASRIVQIVQGRNCKCKTWRASPCAQGASAAA